MSSRLGKFRIDGLNLKINQESGRPVSSEPRNEARSASGPVEWERNYILGAK